LSALPSQSSASAESRCSSVSPAERATVSVQAVNSRWQLSTASATTLSDCTVRSLRRLVPITSARRWLT
jgi:hypothetical protein